MLVHNSAFHPSRVSKWVPASAGKAKAGMVHSISGCPWGVQVKLWDPLKTRAIPERLRGVITTRQYTNPCLPYLIHNDDDDNDDDGKSNECTPTFQRLIFSRCSCFSLSTAATLFSSSSSTSTFPPLSDLSALATASSLSICHSSHTCTNNKYVIDAHVSPLSTTSMHHCECVARPAVCKEIGCIYCLQPPVKGGYS